MKPALAALAILVLLAGSASAARSPRRARRAVVRAAPAGPWRIVETRVPRVHEDAWEPRHPLLRDPLDPNRVPGPAGLAACIRTDMDQHPGLFIEDLPTGKLRRLGGGRWISQPRWSADGEALAATVWRSPALPWLPCVVRVRDGRVVDAQHDLLATTLRWSPDGSHVALSATLPSLDRGVLAVMDANTGEVAILDTLPVLADIQFSWSPDGRTLGYSRPTRVAEGQDLIEASLCLADLDGRRMTVYAAPGRVVREPRFVDVRRVRFMVSAARTLPTVDDQRLVIFERR